MEFEPASKADAAFLLDWRNDPITRSMSIHPDEIEWLGKRPMSPTWRNEWCGVTLKL